MSDNDKGKKLAAEVRAVTASEKSVEFDLAGYGPPAVEQFVQDAFTQPLPLASMVRLSFLVGGGKKVRQKYNDGLPTVFSEALKRCGFVEDRGASLSIDCAGQFKYQHDTDKDLKFVHVYPKLDTAAAAAASAPPPAAADAMSPEALLLYSELATFQRMIAAKTPSFAQQRRALDCLKGYKAMWSGAEAKMTALQPLSEEEQQLYEELDAELLDQKLAALSQSMEAMIANGQLTKNEQPVVLAQLRAKLEALEVQIASAEEAGKAKRVEKLREMHAELQQRITAVKGAPPFVRKPKFELEMKAARKQLKELEKLENTKGVLPLAEVEKLNAKPKLLSDLAAMEAEAAGWFSAPTEAMPAA